VKITVDTNVLVRAGVGDDPAQAAAAQYAMAEAELVAIPSPALCEFAWVLGGVYGFGRADVSRAIETLISGRNIVVDEMAIEAGLALLADGGDFADGVIAYLGQTMGGDTFVSFDKKAVKKLAAQGRDATTPK
jgi:predicted nucleic-acid-binding protein